MGEAIEPDYSLSFKRNWFAEIWQGRKTVEYRRVSPRYRRLADWVGPGRSKGVFMMFYIGMQSVGFRMLVAVKNIDIGECPLKGFDGEYYRITFDVVQYYAYSRGVYVPLILDQKPGEEWWRCLMFPLPSFEREA